MKLGGKFIAIGVAVLAFIALILGALGNQSKTASNYRNKVKDKEANLHKKAAAVNFEKAQDHIQKAKAIQVKREVESSADEDEAIMRWNDDEI